MIIKSWLIKHLPKMVFLNFNITVFSPLFFFPFFLSGTTKKFNDFTTRFLYNKVCILLSFVSLLCSCLKIEWISNQKHTNGTHFFFFCFFYISSLAMKRGQIFFFTSRRISRAAGTAGGERVYGFRLCLDGRTDGRTFYTLLLGGGEKLHRKNQQSRRRVHFCKAVQSSVDC